MVQCGIVLKVDTTSAVGIKARNSRRGSEIKDISLSVHSAPGRNLTHLSNILNTFWKYLL